ncbi:MAG: hypothetical protein GF393_12880 [Armatimonadia bacterium]|nr:hypothetical protein [Armatimonadia bacterium]
MRILLIDIETAPHVVYAWGLFNQNLSPDKIAIPSYTMCWAARWVGEEEIVFSSLFEDGHETMIYKMYDLLDQADVVVHYNGKKFDIPTLNKEFTLLNLPPPHDYKEVDLYHLVRQRFRFASNKLDYIVQELGLGAKVKHKGMDLWTECMSGDPLAWSTMKSYNIQDVVILQNLYEYVLPWIKNHPNFGLFVDSPESPICPNCGSTHVIKSGYSYTSVGKYQRFQCKTCGKKSRARKRMATTSDNVLVGVN